jgi:hypothetical protein
MKDFYILLTVFLAVVIWISCAAVGKSNTGMSASAATMPTYQEELPPYKAFFHPDETQENNVPTRATTRATRRHTSNGYVNGLIECREILDTVSLLNENVYYLMTPASQDSLH